MGQKVRQGPEIWGSFNEIDECQMHQAIECLHEEICARRTVPYRGKIRCTIGNSVVYLCNYNTKDKEFEVEGTRKSLRGKASCDQSQMYEAWRQIRIAKSSLTGWWHDSFNRKTYGFDRKCRDNECDNGWKNDSVGEQCTNIRGKNKPWVFDYEADVYRNYTAQYAQKMPDIHDDNNPVYFNPWFEGQRPK
ncbi:hypothetical protein B0H63DRAFT_408387 [Podospora didyma]|uniref:Uncharacterized protein n=1 Tax=Podospora didyma TaxID=330526 RepID=A0AAE0U930_9PEZI|nr:hypothetical protein B0H63DRAFT_408387 [Podospora didyma]